MNIKGYITVGVYELDEVLPHVKPGNFKKRYGEHSVKLSSVRLLTFKRNNACVCCGVKGTKMLLQKSHGQHAQTPHFNMYAETEHGPRLMTKDHIVPKSQGGSEHPDNMQTMCCKCNEFKGSMNVTLDQLKYIMGIFNSALPRPIKADKIIAYLNDNNIQAKGDRVSKLIRYKERKDAEQERDCIPDGPLGFMQSHGT